MTTQEAQILLAELLSIAKSNSQVEDMEKYEKALQMAIEALSATD